MSEPTPIPPNAALDEAGRAIRVAIAADDPLSRAGLTALIVEAGLDVVPIAAADVVVWDADGGGSPPERTEPLLAVAADPARTVELFAAGAGAVLSRRAGGDRLGAAVAALAAGLGALPLERLRALIVPNEALATELPLEAPTAREREVLELLADGLTNAAIAERLDIGLSTVKFHLGALLSKYAASSRTELVVRAIRSGDLLV